jgi:hypothetical protein
MKVMPSLTPDGESLLYRESGDQASWKVMRISVRGGSSEAVLGGQNINGEFRCGLRTGSRCVLRTVEGDRFVFYELDPRHGRGRELARTAWSPMIVGDWDISPDGTVVAIPNHEPRSAEIRLVALYPARSGIEEKRILLNGLKNLSGVVWAASGRGWFVSVRKPSGGLMVYVDGEGRITNLLDTSYPTYAVPSPDGRHIAFPEWTVSSNAWRFHGL